MTAEQIIALFGMRPLPGEGGFYVETYRAKQRIDGSALPAQYGAPRNFSTAILYLLTIESCSLLHRLKSDEVFHFYLGDPVTMLQLHPRGRSETVKLGHAMLKGQRVQVVVPAGVWQGAFVKPPGRFALLGCTVAPGFNEKDFELGDRDFLLAEYPDRRRLIMKLTPRV